LLLERDGAVASICFNRPSALNAIDPPMARAFLSAARELAADPSVRAVIMRGAGKGFMAGGDLAVLGADPQRGAAELIGPLHEAVRVLDRMDAPLVAQVHGVAAGAGLSLMLQADFVLAAAGTRFNLAYANIGASCDVGASWALPRRVGLRLALEIALLSDTHDANAAERMGLINRVVPAAELGSGPTLALGHLRRLMRSSQEHDLAGQLDAEAAAFQACAATVDFRVGVDAFRNRKTPYFTGH
jgi:2-(1,2-epoxy-1,2-dihydrophenyl)acetyl-CoA isomerase